MVAEEYRNECRLCFPQECEVFKRGDCKGPVEVGQVERVKVETVSYKEAVKIHRKLRW
jgi:hypothetical protein